MLNLATKTNDPDAKLSWRERIGYGTGMFGINAINGIIGSFLTIYFTNVALLDAGVISTLIAVSKIFDGISDLIVGRLVDRTQSRFGKARVWLIRMMLPFALTVMLLFFVPQNFPRMLKYVYVFLMYNIVNTICLTSMMVPFFSMVSLITRNTYERGLLGNIQQIFQTLGNVFVNAVFVSLLTKFTESTETIYTQRAFTLTMMIFCLIMIATTLIAFFTTKERVTEDEFSEKEESAVEEFKEEQTSTWQNIKALLTNKYWMMMIFGNFVIFFIIIFSAVGAIYYSQYVLKDANAYAWMSNSSSIAQFAIMLLTPLFMKKFPKHSIYTTGMAVTTAGYIGFGLWGTTQATMIFFNALKGIGMGISGAMALGMIADAVEYGRLKTHIDAVGMGNAGLSAAQKLGLGLGTAIFGWMLDGAGFDASLDLKGLPQPDSVIATIPMIYTWIPLVMVAAVTLMMLLFYRNIDKDMAKLKEKENHM